MVKAYGWLKKFQQKHPSFTFRINRNGAYLFRVSSKRDYFQVVLGSKNEHVEFKLRFEPNSDFSDIQCIKCVVNCGDRKVSEHSPYKKFLCDELKLELKADSRYNADILISRGSGSAENDLFAWLQQHFDALNEALKDTQLSHEEFANIEKKRLFELCDGGWLKRSDDGSYAVPETAIFSGSEDSEDKDDMLGRGGEAKWTS